jgi:RES domain-containing protein
MPLAWRLVKESYVRSAFTGEGAAKAGGRWNNRGMRVVYASDSLALAALETLVHLNPRMSFRYVYFTARFSASMVEVLKELPPGWNVEPPPDMAKRIGDEWLRAKRSAVLQVPSVLLPEGSNFLFNPEHPDFSKIGISKPSPFNFDPRLFEI